MIYAKIPQREVQMSRKIYETIIVCLLLLVAWLIWANPNFRLGVSEESQQRQQLIEADEHAKYVIERTYYENPERLRGMGMIFDGNLEPNYADFLYQMDVFKSNHSEGTARATIFETFGYESGTVIWSILQNYDEWSEMKGLKQ